jgi:two-component system, LuxR family, response regulator FixJ
LAYWPGHRSSLVEISAQVCARNRGNRWVLAAFAVLGLLGAYLPAYTTERGSGRFFSLPAAHCGSGLSLCWAIGGQRAVAIVDDDDAVRDSLRFWLEIVGHTVETFASAAEFLTADQRPIACLILDHHMPGMTGLELAERLRTDGSLIPILLVTGSPSPTIAARAAELGVNRVLEKPPGEEDVVTFITAARGHGI